MKRARTEVPRGRNPWPIGIAAFFILILAFTLGFVLFSRSQRVDLVSADYYEQEMRYQAQIDREHRTGRLLEPMGIALDREGHRLNIALPRAHAGRITRGSIALYRPSDAALDRTAPLKVDERGCQTLETDGWAPGLWRVRVSWSLEREEFYGETNIVVGRKAG